MHAAELLPDRNSFYCALALLLFACGGGGDAAPANPTGVALRLERIDAALSLGFPIFLTAPPGDTARLFVVEKGGTIKVVNRLGSSLIGTFLDVSSLVSTGGEQGLLGLAFDPRYASNGRFYISYTDVNGNSVIARYLVSSNPDVAVSTADLIILTLAQPFANHNGGMIAFGPDNFLYIGFGDGGSGGDPAGHAQNPADLLGKLLRIDVSQSAASPLPAYAIPPGNPFAAAALGKEIWSLGLRNPWRYSFDRQTGDLYIADVGQGNWEEVNVSTASDGAGKGANYGWNVMEGNHCYPPGTAICTTVGMTLPRLEYDHNNAECSITGGYAYRGAAIPALQGTYFYGDFCAGFVRSFRLINGNVAQLFDWTTLRPGGNITSFGEDAAGEIYIMTSAGGLYRIVAN